MNLAKGVAVRPDPTDVTHDLHGIAEQEPDCESDEAAVKDETEQEPAE